MFRRCAHSFERLLAALDAIANWPVFLAVRSAFVLTLPLVLIGTLAILFRDFPLQAYRDFMGEHFGMVWVDFADTVHKGTIGIMALLLVCSVGPYMAHNHNRRHLLMQADPIVVGFVSLASVMVLIAPGDGLLSWHWLGVGGLFLSVLITVLSSCIFLLLSRVEVLRLNVTESNIDFMSQYAIIALLPGTLTILLFGCVSVAVSVVWNTSVYAGFTAILQDLFSFVDNGIEHGLLYVFSVQSLWFMGVHGANWLSPDLASSGVLTKTVVDTFVFIGGPGSTFSLIMAIFIASRIKGRRCLAAISLVPGLFNINEILLFGLPVVFNPRMLCPFLFVPILLALVTAGALTAGIVPLPQISPELTTPIFLNGYLATGSYAGVLLQAFNIVLAACVYMPFIVGFGRLRKKDEAQAFAGLFERASHVLSPSSMRSLGRQDSVGSLARNLASDLEKACRRRSGLFLHYQPQVSARSGKVFGVEALLRWEHPFFGNIPAPITINLSEESGLVHDIGLFALQQACATRRYWLDNGIKNLVMAVNISALQLKSDLVPITLDILRYYGLPPHVLEFEVTESSALGSGSAACVVLQDLHDLGVRIAIDDFGMGHSSLNYIKDFPVDVIKIDGAITSEITSNAICADIVASITRLCRSRDIMSIAEYVETAEQVNELTKHGCDVYQGYMFSKPLSAEECLGFIRHRMPV